MELATLRELHRASPFKPFVLLLNDGSRVSIREAGAFVVSQDGVSILRPSEGGVRTIRAESVREVQVEPPLPPTAEEALSKIRHFREARPFVAFNVVVDDGRKLSVDQPYRLGIMPRDREIVFAGPPHGFERIPTDRIQSVTLDG